MGGFSNRKHTKPTPAVPRRPNQPSRMATRGSPRISYQLWSKPPNPSRPNKPSLACLLTGAPCQHNIDTHFPTLLFRILMLRRLRFPIPLTARQCQCRRALDTYGDHRAACAQSGILRNRSTPLERAAARMCQEAGARITSCEHISNEGLHFDWPIMLWMGPFHWCRISCHGYVQSTLRGSPTIDWRERSCKTSKRCRPNILLVWQRSVCQQLSFPNWTSWGGKCYIQLLVGFLLSMVTGMMRCQ